jgi:lipopolysaccharide biosynthesis glycosyltransferase
MQALVTVAIGNAYAEMAKITHPLMEKYANKVGCEFVVINRHEGNPYLAKFRVARLLDEFERVLFMDTDMLVRHDCPNLFEMVPPDAFGAFDEHLLANADEKATHISYMEQASKFYGIPMGRFCFFNTGVMVVSKQHAGIFEPPRSFLEISYYDQLLINLRLGNAPCPTKDIGHRFNRMQYVEGRVPGTRLDSYIIHYAGMQKCMEVIQTDIDRWST